ncbi:MAG: phosphoenolpyruvate carboxykinase (ATP) [Gemmatimonadota bacterium]|nr:MAG: phosphoenolpyruvate carboxykinase (ATP) [Gemmatimonadota bacterium]
MIKDLYDLPTYERFCENLRGLLEGRSVIHFKHNALKGTTFKTGTKTVFGSYGWRSSVSSRVAPRTVYLGSEHIRLPKLSSLQKGLIEKAPEELHNVLHAMRTLPFIHIRRQMGENDEFNPICNLYMSVADHKNYRLAYMWGHTMAKPSKRPGPEFTMIDIPEEHMIRQQVLVLPEHNINIALGTDYMGEIKKGFLRQAMWCADNLGMLGLHAGTKLVTVRDAKDDTLKKYGVFLFGLSATGKTTWSCHQLGLDHRRGETTEVIQDDIVFLKRDGSALGSEQNFFVKTDVDKALQEAMYYALIDKTALLENVMIDARGNPDFLDERLNANGRAVIRRDRLKVRRGRRLVGIGAKCIDLPSLDDLDGVIFAFVTRRNTIMPFAQELTPEQAVLAYLWGESSHSFASQPAKAGESVRIVGTDPFIIGSRARKVNRFHEIIMDLVETYPGKVKFYQYNTGGVGEILKEEIDGDIKRKTQVRKVTRVPINLMAEIQRGDLRGTNRYEKGRLGTQEIVSCVGQNLDDYDPKRFYSQEEIAFYLRDIVEGRKKFTEEISDEGLKAEIIREAEKSFAIIPSEKGAEEPPREKEREKTEMVPAWDSFSWEPKTRPPRPGGWRF